MTDSMWMFTQWKWMWINYFFVGLLSFVVVDIVWVVVRNYIFQFQKGN